MTSGLVHSRFRWGQTLAEKGERKTCEKKTWMSQDVPSNLTGILELRFPDESTPYDVFRYQVVRVWELSLERLLTGDLGLLPLAPLTDEAAAQLPAVVGRIEDRLRRETIPEQADKVRAAIFVL